MFWNENKLEVSDYLTTNPLKFFKLSEQKILSPACATVPNQRKNPTLVNTFVIEVGEGESSKRSWVENWHRINSPNHFNKLLRRKKSMYSTFKYNP